MFAWANFIFVVATYILLGKDNYPYLLSIWNRVVATYILLGKDNITSKLTAPVEVVATYILLGKDNQSPLLFKFHYVVATYILLGKDNHTQRTNYRWPVVATYILLGKDNHVGSKTYKSKVVATYILLGKDNYHVSPTRTKPGCSGFIGITGSYGVELGVVIDFKFYLGILHWFSILIGDCDKGFSCRGIVLNEVDFGISGGLQHVQKYSERLRLKLKAASSQQIFS